MRDTDRAGSGGDTRRVVAFGCLVAVGFCIKFSAKFGFLRWVKGWIL